MIHELARHGYVLSPGTLHPMLHGLERGGLPEVTKATSGTLLQARLSGDRTRARGQSAGEDQGSRADGRIARLKTTLTHGRVDPLAK
nr:hypothetical protein [Bradyrhizobium sp. ARR65]